VSTTNAREFSCVERWDGHKALDEHLAAPYMKAALNDVESLVDEPPEIRRYTLV
jgi:quinol monooxygenase YgiN